MLMKHSEFHQEVNDKRSLQVQWIQSFHLSSFGFVFYYESAVNSTLSGSLQTQEPEMCGSSQFTMSPGDSNKETVATEEGEGWVRRNSALTRWWT